MRLIYSIRNAASTIAHGAMSYYNGNVSGQPEMVGDLPDPYYWWQAGALWGAMLDYYHFTGDSSYNDVVIQALTAPVNTGPRHDYNPPEHFDELGNDDLGFWGFAVMAAAERNFPQPDPSVPSWLTMALNIFNALSSRWDTTTCRGGVYWQVFASNPNGINYKNSVTNGGLFQLAARIARATGQQGYADWAAKVWDWCIEIGLIGDRYTVYDGAHGSDDCREVNYVAFTYTTGIFLHGAAVMAEYTGEKQWADRAHKLLEAAAYFFDNNTLYEPACEPNDSCNNDMKACFLKGYLARFMWQSTYHLPSLLPQVKNLLEPSALAAAQACSGGENSVTCGQKWNMGGFDGRVGLGQQMCALETIQGLLIGESRSPLGDGEIDPARHAGWNGRRTAPTAPTNQSVFDPEEEVDVHNEGGHHDETSGGRTTIGGLASPSWIGVCAATLAGSCYILV
ncbi:mannan endo-1,6-alpha-mannosidase DCW1 [Verticillium dahliae VdLs.17]|uniref:Mannan endo-1,6-alpha-mannosidase n=1 Tax=Verticillium dahliae (strain VdLs.17 / ATCC MYA-4575 / FGSC 10137) TaxID=498257 RepID=G2WQF6_VERDV|nr:mannan endo-1,6-alpha-mannosidase DCW1 [Verticillium dahliae VdLs.17]EGY13916.1 mannan endo-1,6-alpha-mannosidase DCW1 [Verticillium dahliae VdLs.17]